jgi:hypothetical protein
MPTPSTLWMFVILGHCCYIGQEGNDAVVILFSRAFRESKGSETGSTQRREDN